MKFQCSPDFGRDCDRRRKVLHGELEQGKRVFVHEDTFALSDRGIFAEQPTENRVNHNVCGGRLSEAYRNRSCMVMRVREICNRRSRHIINLRANN